MNALARLPRLALFNYTANLPCRLIQPEGKPYLERYWLGEKFGRFWYLHRFLRNDAERHLHDHPWDTAHSLVLTGRYTEERGVHFIPRPNATVRATFLHGERQVRWFNTLHRSARNIEIHRITSIQPETWTLFFHGPWEHPWGFYEGALYQQYKDVPYGPEEYAWWHDAQLGRDIGREPFNV